MENQLSESTTGILADNEIRRELFVDHAVAPPECEDVKKDILRVIRERLECSVYIAIQVIDVQFSDGSSISVVSYRPFTLNRSCFRLQRI